MSQTFFVPVNWRSLRSASSNVRRGSTASAWSVPLMCKVTSMQILLPVRRGTWRRLPHERCQRTGDRYDMGEGYEAVEDGHVRSVGEFDKTLFQDVRHWDDKRGEDGRSEGFAGAGTRYEVIEAVARTGMSFDGRGGEINDPCLRDPRCGVER